MGEWTIYPALLDWPDATNDIASVLPNAERLRLVSGFRGFDKLPEIRGLRELWCFDINAEKLAVLSSCRDIRRLFVDGVSVADFSPVTSNRNLEVLSLEDCSKAQNLDSVEECTQLKGLGITNFKNVHSIARISNLVGLKNLAVVGGMWTRMDIDTLEPLSNLKGLEELDLSNTKVRDESLKPLAGLSKLRTLNLPNFFPMEEFAWLSGRLRETKCTWFSPFIEFSHSACKKCGKRTMVMLTGKRKPMLCSSCDKGRLEKHVEMFNRLAG